MRMVIVAGARGGIGKTVVATHLAAHAALAGRYTALLDADPAGLATRWARRRADLRSAVLPLGAACEADWLQRLPYDTERLVVDADIERPAADFAPMFELAQAVVVPVPGSEARRHATAGFLDTLAAAPRVQRGELRVALLGPAPALAALHPAAAFTLLPGLRYSRAYALLCTLGRSLFDYHSAGVRAWQEDWAPLLAWLEPALPAPAGARSGDAGRPATGTDIAATAVLP